MKITRFPKISQLQQLLTLPSAVTERYCLPGWDFLDAASTVTPSAHTLYFIACYTPTPITFDRILAEVTTGGTASDVGRLGLYTAEVDANGFLKPGTLIVDGGTFAADSIAVKLLTISERLTGWFFTAFVTESGVFRRPGSGGIRTPFSPSTRPTMDFQFAGGQGIYALLTDANAGADWPTNGLPATAPAITTNVQANGIMTLLRTSS